MGMEVGRQVWACVLQKASTHWLHFVSEGARSSERENGEEDISGIGGKHRSVGEICTLVVETSMHRCAFFSPTTTYSYGSGCIR